MKKILFFTTIAIVALSSCGRGKVVEKVYNTGINITPKPLELKEGKGSFTLSNNTAFFVEHDSLSSVAQFFAKKIKKSTGLDLKIMQIKPSKKMIDLQIDNTIPVNYEGYLLNVTPKSVKITAKTKQGLFYGMQTVMQLLPAEIESDSLVSDVAWTIPVVSVKDEPRFHYRGQMQDVGRHFFDINFIKKQLDILAMYKINKYHFHLTEDQGWRIEIKKYPKLTEMGSKRIDGEGTTYGPYFFTQKQIKEIVAYAKARYIEVIPEIEMPGHSVAALTAYPQFACKKGPFHVRNTSGVSTDVYCAGNEDTFKFLDDVIAEVAPLFPSKYFHIGGDECPKDSWKACPKCQAKIRLLKLKGDKKHTAEEKLQSYFVERAEKILAKYGKKMIGWDEILEGGLAKSATVMSWRGEQGGIDAGNMNHDVIMTPYQSLYLDAFQGDSRAIKPTAIGGHLTLADVYSYDPIPKGLDADKAFHVLGTQANVWTEYMYTPQIAEWRIYPRILALSEVAWTAKDKKDYKDFLRRLDNQRVRLDMHHVNYYIPMPEQTTPSCDYVAFTDKTTLAFKTTEPVKMVYTLDGSEPNASSTQYTQPLTFDKNTTLKIRSVLVSGKMSPVRTIQIVKETFAPAITKDAGTKPGLKVEFYKGLARKVSEMAAKPFETKYFATPQDAKPTAKLGKDDVYNMIMTGYFSIPKDGVYYFSSFNEQVWIDGKLFINNAGMVKNHTLADKSIALSKGTHSIKIVVLSDIIGGYPTQWASKAVLIREANEKDFKKMDAVYFK